MIMMMIIIMIIIIILIIIVHAISCFAYICDVSDIFIIPIIPVFSFKVFFHTKCPMSLPAPVMTMRSPCCFITPLSLCKPHCNQLTSSSYSVNYLHELYQYITTWPTRDLTLKQLLYSIQVRSCYMKQCYDIHVRHLLLATLINKLQ